MERSEIRGRPPVFRFAPSGLQAGFRSLRRHAALQIPCCLQEIRPSSSRRCAKRRLDLSAVARRAKAEGRATGESGASGPWFETRAARAPHHEVFPCKKSRDQAAGAGRTGPMARIYRRRPCIFLLIQAKYRGFTEGRRPVARREIGHGALDLPETQNPGAVWASGRNSDCGFSPSRFLAGWQKTCCQDSCLKAGGKNSTRRHDHSRWIIIASY